MSRSYLLVGLALLAGVSSANAQRSTITRDAFRPRADSLVYVYLAESHAPSASFAVIRGNDTLAYGAYGLANVEAWRAPTATTIYEIGSNTKQFTSAAIMRLVEQGRVKLDDDLSKYVPQFPLHGHKVSIHQLLTHTSGIHRLHVVAGVAEDMERPLSPDAIVKFVAADTFDFAPGTAYRYDNTGYVLLGMVIEKASGQKYAKLSRRAILQAARTQADLVLPVEDVRSRLRTRLQQGTDWHDARAVHGSLASIRCRSIVLHGGRFREVAARARRRKGGVARVVRADVDRRHAEQWPQDQLRLRPRAGRVQRPQDHLAHGRHSRASRARRPTCPTTA